MSTYVYLPEYDGTWGVMSRDEYDETGGYDTYGSAEPLELEFNLEGWRGHYLTADFLSQAADLLEACQLDTATYHLDERLAVGLRDRVDQLKDEANKAWAQYHAHNDLHPNPDWLDDYGTECPDGDCACLWINDIAQDMEDLLSDLGFVVEWNDGVYVYRVLPVCHFCTGKHTYDNCPHDREGDYACNGKRVGATCGHIEPGIGGMTWFEVVS